MSRYSTVTCDVCGKRGTERISDWFEIDAGPEGFFAVPQVDRSAGVGRTSKDICGSRCLCVALERWVNRQLRQTRDLGPAQPEPEPQEWIVPRRAQPSPSLMLEGPQRVQIKPPKGSPDTEVEVTGVAVTGVEVTMGKSRPEEKRRRGMLFRRAVTR